MNWLTNFVRPKIQAIVNSEVPDHLWIKCPNCEEIIFHKEINENLRICTRCEHHFQLPTTERIALIMDDGYTRIPYKPGIHDPLKFKDTKKYTDRLKAYASATQEPDVLIALHGHVHGVETVCSFFNFEFMGGSMGSSVGENFLAAVDFAIQKRLPFVVFTASGGARMQEGIFALMQMPKTIVGVHQLRDAGLPYIVVLTNPTTGGVSASFAMLGDIHIAEKEALIAFTGRRVIEGTIRQKLPDNFQTAEYLQEHGIVDIVVSRKDMKKTIAQVLQHLSRNIKETESSHNNSITTLLQSNVHNT